METRKEIKLKAKKSFKKNYWRCVAIAFFIAFMLGNLNMNNSKVVHSNISSITKQNGFYINSLNSEIVEETITKVTNVKTDIASYKPTRGILANMFNNITASGNFFFGLLNSFNQLFFHERLWASLIILLGAILSFLYWLLIKNVLIVGEARFFLENRKYKKTNFKRILLPYRIKKLKDISLTMMVKKVKEWLWFLTIIGGFIKHYSYYLVPFILAENPDISGKKALELSKNMMQGHKWELFKFDLTFIGWNILDVFTFHLIGMIYITPYKKCCTSEIYMQIRAEAKAKKIKNSELLKDEYLNVEGEKYPKDKYLFKEKSHKWLNTDFMKNYSVLSLILMFFTASIIGWIWEVGLHLFQYGSFVNRGTLHGPWIQIYGFGVVLLLVVLKKVRNKPILTFLLTLLLCGIVEYTTGWYLETFKHARWWDYDGFFLNLHGRICLEGLIAFGIGGCAFIYFAAPLLESIYAKISKKIKIILCIILCTGFTIDFIYSSKYPNQGDGVSQSFITQEKST